MYSSASQSASPPTDKKETAPVFWRRALIPLRCAALAWLLLGAPALAWPQAPPARVRVDFQRASLTDVTGFMARLTGRSFLIDPAVADREVTWLAPREVTPREAWEAFTVTLAGMGLVVQRHKKFYRISAAGGSPGAHLAPVRHADAAELAHLLGRLAPPQDQILASPDGRHLILLQPPARRQRTLALLRALDRPEARRQVHLHRLQHADAAALADLLRQVYGGPDL